MYLHFFHEQAPRIELKELYASVAIRSFGLGLVNIFVPIYLLTLGFPLSSVFLFLAVVAFSQCLFTLPAGWIAHRFGFKHSIAFGIPILIIYLIALYTLPDWHWPLLLIASLIGIADALYFIGYHLHFARFSSDGQRGKQLGKILNIHLLSSALAPFIGGFLLTSLGFHIVFILAMGILCLSVLPLFFSLDTHEPSQFLIQQTFSHQSWRDILGHIGWGMERGVGEISWAILIFLILGSFTTLGFITSLSFIASIGTTYFIGLLIDRRHHNLLRIGSGLSVFVWLLRSLVLTTGGAIFANILYGVIRPLTGIPLGVMVYERANRHNPFNYLVARDLVNTSTSGFLFILLAKLDNPFFGLILAATGCLLYILFVYPENKNPSYVS